MRLVEGVPPPPIWERRDTFHLCIHMLNIVTTVASKTSPPKLAPKRAPLGLVAGRGNDFQLKYNHKQHVCRVCLMVLWQGTMRNDLVPRPFSLHMRKISLGTRLPWEELYVSFGASRGVPGEDFYIPFASAGTYHWQLLMHMLTQPGKQNCLTASEKLKFVQVKICALCRKYMQLYIIRSC